MAEIKSFPNNQDEYSGAEDVMRWLHGRTSGVFAAAGNAAVAALATPGMAVTVSDGTGWMANANNDGVVWWNDSESANGYKLQLTIDAADGVLNRIDRVIVEWKTTNYVDRPEIKVLKGTASSAAAAPALTNNSTKRQISLAKISVAAGTTAITARMITDERQNTAVCGLVTDSLSIDTSVINAQFSELLEQLRTAIEQASSGVLPDGSVTTAKYADKSVTLAKLAADVTEDIAAKQPKTNNLTAETTLADGDYFPFYDVSATANRKTPWSNIISKIRTALFGSANGFLKANGSGVVSAVATVPVANGGTGATTAAAARTNLGITPANIGALSAAAGAVGGSNLADGAVGTAALGSGAVIGGKIANGAVGTSKIAYNAVQIDRLADEVWYGRQYHSQSTSTELWSSWNRMTVLTGAADIFFRISKARSDTIKIGYQVRLLAIDHATRLNIDAIPDMYFESTGERKEYTNKAVAIEIPFGRYMDLQKISEQTWMLTGNYADPMISGGTAAPSGGNNGDIYIQYSSASSANAVSKADVIGAADAVNEAESPASEADAAIETPEADVIGTVEEAD